MRVVAAPYDRDGGHRVVRVTVSALNRPDVERVALLRDDLAAMEQRGVPTRRRVDHRRHAVIGQHRHTAHVEPAEAPAGRFDDETLMIRDRVFGVRRITGRPRSPPVRIHSFAAAYADVLDRPQIAPARTVASTDGSGNIAVAFLGRFHRPVDDLDHPPALIASALASATIVGRLGRMRPRSIRELVAGSTPPRTATASRVRPRRWRSSRRVGVVGGVERMFVFMI